MLIDTSDLGVFNYSQDLADAYTCSWVIDDSGNLYQEANAGSSDTDVFGCNAIVNGTMVTDFLMQVDILNDDNDAVGFSAEI